MNPKLCFENVLVGPTEEILKAPSGSLFKGGPLWPDFDMQLEARHCRELKIKAVDSKPNFNEDATCCIKEAFWCGPIVNHFGHMIADFGTRLAQSAYFHPEVTLIFSIHVQTKKNTVISPPNYFWEMIDHFRIQRNRIFFANQVIFVRKLHVYPQAERIRGPVPDSSYLDLIDNITATEEVGSPKINYLYVSRANYLMGGIAGEKYLEYVLRLVGFKIMRPEDLSLHEQIKIYKASKKIFFSEGSAVHALQLLGHLNADVSIIVRRPKARIAKEALSARVLSLNYLDFIHGLLFGLRSSGHPNESKGITLLNSSLIVSHFQNMGFDLSHFWSEDLFKLQQNADIEAWINLRINNIRRHPDESEFIKSALVKLNLPIPKWLGCHVN
jgi:hypothetical protein